MLNSIFTPAAIITGGLLASAEMRRQRRDLNSEAARNDDHYRRLYNENPTARADARRLLRLTTERLLEGANRAAGRRAVNGASAHEEALERQAAVKAVADAASAIDAAGEKRREYADNAWNERRDMLRRQLAQLRNNRAINIANAVRQMNFDY